jgi:hypothetical protein
MDTATRPCLFFYCITTRDAYIVAVKPGVHTHATHKDVVVTMA